MIDVELQTNTGDFIVTVEVIPFQTMPEVLLWGERCFKRCPSPSAAAVEEIYQEVFFVVVPPDNTREEAK